MKRIAQERLIDAPLDLVFETVADIRNYAEAIPHIQEVSILSEVQVGVGTRFRETRRVAGQEATTELEVTEYEANRRYRCVSDTHGTIWDSIFGVEERDGKTRLTLVLNARPKSVMTRLMNPMIRGMVAKAISDDLDAVKTYCEAQGKRA